MRCACRGRRRRAPNGNSVGSKPITTSYVAMKRSAPISLLLHVNGASPAPPPPNSHAAPRPCRRRRGIRGAVRIRIGIRRVLRPDARIEDANHDARSAPLIAQRMQHFGADEGGAAVRVELQQFIAIDLLHARQSTQGRDVLLRHDHRNAAHHQIQVMNDSRRRQRSSDGGCKRAPLFGQLRELASCGRRRHVDLPQTVCAQRRAGDRGDRVARELDDDWNHRAASPTLVEVRRTYRSRRLQCSAGRPQLCGRFLRRN